MPCLLDEVKTLERRGDEIMAERRTEDALDLYSTALDSAVEYAARKDANSAAKDQVVKLQRKLACCRCRTLPPRRRARPTSRRGRPSCN